MTKPEPSLTLFSLLENLKNSDAAIRRKAVNALRDLGEKEAVEPLIEALTDPSIDVRKAAAIALGELGDIRAIHPLIQLLNDPDDDVALTAGSSLSPELSEHSLPVLIDVANDKNQVSRVRAIAVWTLHEFGGAQVVETLIRLLADDEDSEVRYHCTESLGSIGGAEASRALIAALQDESSEVRAGAATALRRFDEVQSVKQQPKHWARLPAQKRTSHLLLLCKTRVVTFVPVPPIH